MRLPNPDRAVVDIAKLRDYCLCPSHRRGRHKARVFASVLGISRDNADLLRQALLVAAVRSDALAGDRDEYGQRYVIDCQVAGPAGAATVRSNWIVLAAEDFPRLTSCYVL